MSKSWGEIRNEALRKCGQLSPKPITNADRIRSMTDEELAEWIAHLKQPLYCCFEFGNCGDDCSECALKWLKKEVDT